MTHFDEQNEPLCDAKWPILKTGKIFLRILYDSFTNTTAFVFVE